MSATENLIAERIPPTREQIEELKRQWENDPCWDLECTEGFEEVRDELRAHSEAKEREWQKEMREREYARLQAERARIQRLMANHGYYLENTQRQQDGLANALVVDRLDRIANALEQIATALQACTPAAPVGAAS